MNFLNVIEKAITLFSEASTLLEKAKPSLDNIRQGESATLDEAQTRLRAAMGRAHNAHDDLEQAIADQLAKK